MLPAAKEIFVPRVTNNPGAVRAYTAAERIVDRSQENNQTVGITIAERVLSTMSEIALTLTGPAVVRTGNSGMRVTVATTDIQLMSRVTETLKSISTIDHPPPVDLRVAIEIGRAALHNDFDPGVFADLLNAHLTQSSASRLKVVHPHLSTWDFPMYLLREVKRSPKAR